MKYNSIQESVRVGHIHWCVVRFINRVQYFLMRMEQEQVLLVSTSLVSSITIIVIIYFCWMQTP